MRKIKRLLVSLIAAVMIVLLVVVGGVVVTEPIKVYSAKDHQFELAQQYDFDPGLIISDVQFFDSDAMSTYEIQNFLNSKGSKCTGNQCLKNYVVTTLDEPDDSLCQGYQGGQRQSAAQIIDGAARSCGISQKVLIVMLEKEQGLVTTTKPTAQRYQSALGLSCPDNGSCDPAHGGFFNQVYGAARRFRYYQAHMDQYRYHPNRLNYVQYHPNAACGGSDVWIESQATALLYIYTPYQPNTAALKAGLGSGDSCSSYGNRNFGILYESWFSDPRAS